MESWVLTLDLYASVYVNLREFNFFAEMKKIFAKIEIALLFQDLKSDRFVDNGLEKTLLMLLLLLLQLLLLQLLLLLLL